MTKKEIVPSDKETQNDIEKNLDSIEKNLKSTAVNVSKIVGELWKLGSFAIKAAPKVIATTGEARRVISESIVGSIEGVQKKVKEKELDDDFEKLVAKIDSKQKLKKPDSET